MSLCLPWLKIKQAFRTRRKRFLALCQPNSLNLNLIRNYVASLIVDVKASHNGVGTPVSCVVFAISRVLSSTECRLSTAWSKPRRTEKKRFLCILSMDLKTLPIYRLKFVLSDPVIFRPRLVGTLAWSGWLYPVMICHGIHSCDWWSWGNLQSRNVPRGGVSAHI